MSEPVEELTLPVSREALWHLTARPSSIRAGVPGKHKSSSVKPRHHQFDRPAFESPPFCGADKSNSSRCRAPAFRAVIHATSIQSKSWRDGSSGRRRVFVAHALNRIHGRNTHGTDALIARTGLVAHKQKAKQGWSDGVSKQLTPAHDHSVRCLTRPVSAGNAIRESREVKT